MRARPVRFAPPTRSSLRAAWEAKLRGAEEHRRRQAEWARMQEPQAIAAGEDSDPDEDLDDEDGPAF